MRAPRGALLTDQEVTMELVARECVMQEGAREQAVACVSRDVELALQLMLRDATSLGVSHNIVLTAQLVPKTTTAEAPATAGLKGKEKVGSAAPTTAERGTVRCWRGRSVSALGRGGGLRSWHRWCSSPSRTQ